MYYGTPVPIVRHHLPTDKGNYREVFKIDVLAKLAFLKWGLGVNDKNM